MKKLVLALLMAIVIFAIGYGGLYLTSDTTKPTLVYGHRATYDVLDNPNIAFYIEWQLKDGLTDEEVAKINIITTDTMYKTNDVSIAIKTLINEFNKRGVEYDTIECELIFK